MSHSDKQGLYTPGQMNPNAPPPSYNQATGVQTGIPPAGIAPQQVNYAPPPGQLPYNPYNAPQVLADLYPIVSRNCEITNFHEKLQ